MPIAVSDLLLAYRQAKFALTEERLSVGLVNLATFENGLNKNMRQLSLALSSGGGFGNVPLGEVWLSPKSVSYERDARPVDVVAIAEPLQTQRLSEVHVRCHLQPSIEFSIAEILWTWRYGSALDGLLSRHCVANRVQRDRAGNPDRWTRRLFQFWKLKYRRFQDDGLAAARKLLEQRGYGALVTFDIRSYYDNIDPSFLLSEPFLASLRPRLSDADRDAYVADTSGLLLKYAEYQTAAEHLLGILMLGRGIPIGALSSRLVANLALAPLDEHIARKATVYHYARWVDDLVVVLDNVAAREGLDAITEELLPLERPKVPGSLWLNATGMQRFNSHFEINRAKARIYWLEGLAGTDFLKVIKADLDAIVSEQNAFGGGVSRKEGTKSLLAMAGLRGDDGPEAFQGIDEVRIRRFASSVLISKELEVLGLLAPDKVPENDSLHALVRVLAREQRWTAFLDILLRILSVGVASRDEILANSSLELLHRWAREVERLEQNPSWGGRSIGVSALVHVSRFLHARAVEAVCRALPLDQRELKRPKTLSPMLTTASHTTGYAKLLKSAKQLLLADLRLFEQEVEFQVGSVRIRRTTMKGIRSLITGTKLEGRLRLVDRFLRASRSISDNVYGLGASALRVFLMTRPPSVFDISIRWNQAHPNSPVPPVKVVNAVRGTNYSSEMARWLASGDKGGHLSFPSDGSSEPDAPVRIALVNLFTSNDWFDAAARGTPATSRSRLRAFEQVVNKARSLRRQGERLLVLFPELSVPRQWLRSLATRLITDQIAFVAGLEYNRLGSTVANEAVAVLPGDFFRVGVGIWRKVTPAVGEEARFLRSNGLTFASAIHLPGARTVSSPWGAFSVLICSELLEVSARARLPGRVDYVLVPSWNRDRFTFEYLAQAAVLDLHAYVAIANNAAYSDCRIRGPYKEDYRRDVCRLIDRNVNSVISGVPEILALRRFQSASSVSIPVDASGLAGSEGSGEPENTVFKPIPPGFRYLRPSW
ncbi:hypothetical protein [Sorangium sp. So ce1099]|uniref:hypothetical protein n=1 Tax=Sorangium sp. So ce1099 TaxID=3133331 RepID=UPI003F5DF7F0